jgi:hypothetical protein
MTMRTTICISIVAVVVLGVTMTVAVAGASSAAPPELVVSDLFTGPGHMTKLRAGVAYQASQLPVALRVTPPDGTWSGAQWKANKFSPEEIERRHLTCSTSPAVCAPPYFGWAAVGLDGTVATRAPRGLILIMTSYERTRSVAATVGSLRTRGRGATYGPSTPATVAGYSGVQFGGEIVGPKHIFVPFSPRTTKATGFADAIEMDGPGHAFRFIVLDVRGKTVVIHIGSIVLSTDQFPRFLEKAERVLESLRFPK